MNSKINNLSIIVFFFFLLACKEAPEDEKKQKTRIFPGYHILMDEIVRSREGLFRGLDLNSKSEKIKMVETQTPAETSPGHLFFEYKIDSLTSYSIDYTLTKDSLEEISLQINTDDLELSTYLFCDLKDYYANKLPNPTEDQGYVVYNCFEGQRKPFVVSLSDNSSPSKGIINMLIYKDK